MVHRIVFLVPAFALSCFVVSRIGGLAGKIEAHGVAWAQDSSPADDDDGAGSNSSDEALQSEKKPPPSDVAGSWCGGLIDDGFGDGTINFEIDQKGSKLRGRWSEVISDGMQGSGPISGTAKGKIKGHKITATFDNEDAPPGNCKIEVFATLVEPGIIMGSYHRSITRLGGCESTDGGTFEIMNPCPQ